MPGARLLVHHMQLALCRKVPGWEGMPALASSRSICRHVSTSLPRDGNQWDTDATDRGLICKVPTTANYSAQTTDVGLAPWRFQLPTFPQGSRQPGFLSSPPRSEAGKALLGDMNHRNGDAGGTTSAHCCGRVCAVQVTRSCVGRMNPAIGRPRT